MDEVPAPDSSLGGMHAKPVNKPHAPIVCGAFPLIDLDHRVSAGVYHVRSTRCPKLAPELRLILPMHVAMHHMRGMPTLEHVVKAREPPVRQVFHITQPTCRGMREQQIDAAQKPDLRCEPSDAFHHLALGIRVPPQTVTHAPAQPRDTDPR